MHLDYINIKFDNTRYIQRHEYGKILIFNDNSTKETADNIDCLNETVQNLIKDMLKVKENPDDYFTYEESNENSDEIKIKSYSGKNIKHLVIPEKIHGKKVTYVSKIFDENEKIETIIFPDSITKIDKMICEDLSNLKYVQLSSNITNIPSASFARCHNLKKINLENVKEIGTYAFFECELLDNLNLKNIEFLNDKAFELCSNLSSISLPKIQKINDSVFSHCENLTSVKLGDNLSEIPYGVFSFCCNLEKIKLPENLKIIGPSAFTQTNKLTFINFPILLESIGTNSFFRSGLCGEITIPPSVKKIWDNAFRNTKIEFANISKHTKYESDSFYTETFKGIKKYDSISEKIKNKFKTNEER